MTKSYDTTTTNTGFLFSSVVQCHVIPGIQISYYFMCVTGENPIFDRSFQIRVQKKTLNFKIWRFKRPDFFLLLYSPV